MATTTKSIEVEAPLQAVYNQWTQFEEFPRFMEGVKRVNQLDDSHLHWIAEVAGRKEEWDAVITQQVPDRTIAWESQGGSRNAGRVDFEQNGPTKTKVTLKLDYEPEGAIESTGSALGVVSGRVENDLEKFKDFIEARGRETGAWRGSINN